jgi:hypothetical protein
VINLSFTYAGLKIFGRPGAAYASVGYHILGLLLIYGVLKRQVKIEMRNILSYVVGNYSQVFSIARKYLSGDHKLKEENPKVDAES